MAVSLEVDVEGEQIHRLDSGPVDPTIIGLVSNHQLDETRLGNIRYTAIKQ